MLVLSKISRSLKTPNQLFPPRAGVIIRNADACGRNASQRHKLDIALNFLDERPLAENTKAIGQNENVTNYRVVKHCQKMLRESLKVETQPGHEDVQSRCRQ